MSESTSAAPERARPVRRSDPPGTDRGMATWRRGVARAVERGPVVHVGIGVDDVAALVAAGADVRAAVAVHPSGAAPATHPTVPTLAVPARALGSFALQAGGFSEAVDAAAPAIVGFLDEHDPTGEAVVVGTLSAPTHGIGRREAWVPPSHLASALEAKSSTGSPLSDAVRWVPAEAGPAHADEAWWRSVTERLGAERVVVQEVGLSAAGERTWLCADLAQAQAALRSCTRGARVSPWLEGISANVCGVVARSGDVLALPPSRQVMMAPAGHTVYVGNAVGGRWSDGLEELTEAVCAAGREMAQRGYVGLFGLDAIVGSSGAWFHDLNARLNGAVSAIGLRAPILAGTMLLSGWGADADLDLAAQELRRALDERPAARWILYAPIGSGAAASGAAPPEGLYRVDPTAPHAELVGPADLEAVDGDLAVLRHRAVLNAEVRPGDRVGVGVASLFLAPDLSDALVAAHGDQAVARVLTALRGATRA